MAEAWRSGQRAEDIKREAEEEINRALRGKVFASLDEANAIVAPIIERRNHQPQALHRFAEFLGLAELRQIGEPRELRYEVRKLPLLDMTVKFTQ